MSSADAGLRARWRMGGLLVCRDDLAAERALAAELQNGPLWDARAGTFATLRARVRDDAGLGDRDDPGGLALRCAITEALDAPGAGHVAPLERLVLELRASRVSPVDFATRAAALGFDPLAEAARIYAAVADAPSPEAADWQTVDAAADVVLGPVFALGFDDYSPLEWALLRNLARNNPVQAALAYEQGRLAYQARHQRAARWRAEADHIEEYPADEPTGAIGFLERRLFEVTTPAAGLSGVEWSEAAGTEMAHRLAAAAVLDALTAGVPSSQIAVVVPRLSEQRTRITTVLHEAGIAHRYATRLPFATSQLGRALLDLWAFACDREAPDSLDRLLGWLRSPFSVADPSDVDRFEVAMRRTDSASRGLLMARWEGLAIQPAITLAAQRDRPLRSQVRYLVRLGHEALVAIADGLPPNPERRHDAAALSALAGLSEQLADDDPPARRGEVLPGLLGALLGDVSYPDRAGAPGSVCLIDAAQARGLRFRHVVVTGLEQGEFPGSPAADPYLPDTLRDELGLLPPRAPGTSESRLRFHAACAAAGERLVLVRRYADDDGRDVAASPYWNETRRLLGRTEPHEARHGTSVYLRNATAARSVADHERALALVRVPAGQRLALALARRDRQRGIAARLEHLTAFRVTELEGFLRCGYGWFVDSLIAPQPLREEFDRAAEGTFGHGIMQTVYTELCNAGAGPCGATNVADYHAALDRAIDGSERASGAGRAYDAFVARMRAQLHARLRREAALGPRFVPSEFELALKDDTLVAGVTVRGRCDRIDVSRDGRHLVAIDYKRTGRVFDKEGEIYLQLPLYSALAARDRGSSAVGGVYVPLLNENWDARLRDDVEVYANPDDKWLRDAADWQDRIEHAREQARTAIELIRSGAIPADAVCDKDYCGHGLLWR